MTDWPTFITYINLRADTRHHNTQSKVKSLEDTSEKPSLSISYLVGVPEGCSGCFIHILSSFLCFCFYVSRGKKTKKNAATYFLLSLSEWPHSRVKWKVTLDLKREDSPVFGGIGSMLFWKCNTLTHAVSDSAGVHVAPAISGSAEPQLCHLAWNCELRKRQVPDFSTHCDWGNIHSLYLSFASVMDSEWSHLGKVWG